MNDIDGTWELAMQKIGSNWDPAGLGLDKGDRVRIEELYPDGIRYTSEGTVMSFKEPYNISLEFRDININDPLRTAFTVRKFVPAFVSPWKDVEDGTFGALVTPGAVQTVIPVIRDKGRWRTGSMAATADETRVKVGHQIRVVKEVPAWNPRQSDNVDLLAEVEHLLYQLGYSELAGKVKRMRAGKKS